MKKVKIVFLLERAKQPVQRQRGAVLLVSLIMLLLLTVIGTAAINISSTDTKMTANARDRQIAFQSAETGLVAAEDHLDVEEELPETGVTLGYVGEIIALNRWWAVNDDVWWAANSDTFDAYTGEQDPVFVIEAPVDEIFDPGEGVVASGGLMLGEGLPDPRIFYYRSTSRGDGPGGSKVTLQSIYAIKVFSSPL